MKFEEFETQMLEKIKANKKGRFIRRYNDKRYSFRKTNNDSILYFIIKYGLIIFSTLIFLLMLCDMIKPDLIRPRNVSDFSSKSKIENIDDYFIRIGKTEKQIKINKLTDITTDVLKIAPIVISIAKKHPIMYIAYAGTYITETVFGSALRVIVKAPRPDDIENKTSFPSGHSIYVFSIATILALFLRNKYIISLSFGLAFAVFYGRLLANRHYFIDVFCGAVIGCGFAVLCFIILMEINNRLNIFEKRKRTISLFNINKKNKNY